MDLNIVPANLRRKKILIANMNSTIITSESFDDLATLAGLGDAVKTMTKRAMAGEIDFKGALFHRVIKLADKSSRRFEQLIASAT